VISATNTQESSGRRPRSGSTDASFRKGRASPDGIFRTYGKISSLTGSPEMMSGLANVIGGSMSLVTRHELYSIRHLTSKLSSFLLTHCDTRGQDASVFLTLTPARVAVDLLPSDSRHTFDPQSFLKPRGYRDRRPGNCFLMSEGGKRENVYASVCVEAAG
jgi:hypothetical protein